MHMLYFLYSFICQQTQVDSKYCMLWKILQWTWNCRYLFRIWYLFHFIWLYTEKRGFGSYCSLGLNFLWNVHLIFQNDYTNVYSHQKYTRVLLHKIIPVILYYFDKSHFNRHEIIPYCDFDLPFPDDLWCICVSSFEKCLFSSFDHFLIGLFSSYWVVFSQFRSVAQSCPTLCNPMNCSTPGLPVHHQLPEFTQTHVHRVSVAIQPSHPLSPPSPPALNPSQHQSLFQWVNSSHEVAKVLEFQL